VLRLAVGVTRSRIMGRNGLVGTIRLSITPTANRNSCRVARLVGAVTQGSVLRPQPWAGKSQLLQSCRWVRTVPPLGHLCPLKLLQPTPRSAPSYPHLLQHIPTPAPSYPHLHQTTPTSAPSYPYLLQPTTPPTPSYPNLLQHTPPPTPSSPHLHLPTPTPAPSYPHLLQHTHTSTPSYPHQRQHTPTPTPSSPRQRQSARVAYLPLSVGKWG